MLGGAVGDAMGFATEGKHYTAIRRLYGRVEAPMVRPNFENMDPPVTTCVYTDDTIMKHMVCEAIFDAGGHPTIEAVANVWRRTIKDLTSWHWWCNTRVVAAKLQNNRDIDLHQVGRDSVPCNDAAMIIGPVGMLNAGDPQRAATEAWDISALWEHGYSRECAASMAAAHAHALTSGATVESIIDTAKRFGPTLAPYVDRALGLVTECSSADELTERFYAEQLPFPNDAYWNPPNHPDPEWSFGADPLEVCTEALAFLTLSKGNAREAILGAINFGRDCDTIAGIAAAFCGALHGPDAIPNDWAQTILEANPEPDIADYSERLCLLVEQNVEQLDAQVRSVRSLL